MPIKLCHHCGCKYYETDENTSCTWCKKKPSDKKTVVKGVKRMSYYPPYNNQNWEWPNDLPQNKNNKGAFGNDYESCWEVEIDKVSECSKAPKTEDIMVWVCPLAKVKIDALMEKYKNIEWFAYLLGETSEDKMTYTVNDIHIPDQVVTGTSVDSIVCPEYNDLPIIGAMHSHHGMGNGFSGHDHEFVNGNHNLSLCIAKQGIAGQIRWQTPCGALKIISIPKERIKPKIDVDFDKKAFLEKETSKVKQKTYSRNTTYNQNQKKYSNGVSVKTAAANAKEEWDTGLNSDDAPKYDKNQSLADALKEAFG